MQVIWAIIIGAIVGFIARWISPSPHNPRGFILTTALGIVGSVVATFLGRAIHLYGPDQEAGIIASIIGALIILWCWHTLAAKGPR
ncbi:MAG: GlsB/YeaQ/YmgE family stress response membrane protein [Acetobacteraceae bacterium]|nr:GlsB/YeaQ/YmgE family stress response membrane protein [Acetobacteraceae bacterium]